MPASEKEKVQQAKEGCFGGWPEDGDEHTGADEVPPSPESLRASQDKPDSFRDVVGSRAWWDLSVRWAAVGRVWSVVVVDIENKVQTGRTFAVRLSPHSSLLGVALLNGTR